MVAMAVLMQASNALSATRREAAGSWRSAFQCGSVSEFSGRSLAKLCTKPATKLHRHPGVVVARGAKPAKEVVAKSCEVGDHFLDNVSNYIFHQIKRPFAKYIPDDWDPLDFLPVNIQSSLQKSEALATLVVRETLVFAMVFLVYQKFDVLCRLLYGAFTHKQRKGQPIDEDAYEESPFRAARRPVQSLIMIWATTRLLWVTSVLWKMQGVITPAVIYKIRAVSVVCTICWFFFKWKELYVEELVRQKPGEESRIFAIDKIVSLAMYGLAASCIAEVLGLALGSLLAVGGVSGLAVGLAAKEVVGNMFGGASLFITRPFVIGEKIKVITNFSRAKSKVLEASFQLNNRHIFLVTDITLKVQKYLATHPGVETVKATPICYLKNMERDGPEIALSCVIKSVGGATFYKYQQEILIHVARIITDTLGEDSPFTPLEDPVSTRRLRRAKV